MKQKNEGRKKELKNVKGVKGERKGGRKEGNITYYSLKHRNMGASYQWFYSS